jgi:dTDP-4-dehydrorhamnose reductase
MKVGDHLDILVTGAEGQLGKELIRRLGKICTVIGINKKELDITNQKEVENKILTLKPKRIIHAAAYTKVDQCEIDRKKAFDVNCLGTGYVAKAATKVGARMFNISTDYVFDGEKTTPYMEEDAPNPQSVYGMSKWLGERLTLQLNEGVVIRTSWLYGHDGNNFVKTILKHAKTKKVIKVVDDQIGSPTYVNDLVENIIALLDKKSGIYHVTNSGSCSWFEFAKTILKEAGMDHKIIQPIKTEEYAALAKRPRYSVLGSTSLQMKPRTWNQALKEYIRKEFADD